MHGCTADGRASVVPRHYAVVLLLKHQEQARQVEEHPGLAWSCYTVFVVWTRVEHGDTSSDRTLANGSCSMGVGTRSTGSHLRVTRCLSRTGDGLAAH